MSSSWARPRRRARAASRRTTSARRPTRTSRRTTGTSRSETWRARSPVARRPLADRLSAVRLCSSVGRAVLCTRVHHATQVRFLAGATMNKQRLKKRTLAVLDRLERWVDGDVSIRRELHRAARTYGERLEKWLDEAEKKK